MEKTLPFALYDAFSDRLFGGSQGGIVLEAEGLNADTRQSIARELGFPATCFVSAITQTSVTARFHSTEREYPMCGHGTLCLMSHLLQSGLLQMGGAGRMSVDLVLPTKTATVEILAPVSGLWPVMLDIEPPRFRRDKLDADRLARVLGLQLSDLSGDYPMETAVGDFTHLIVPLTSLEQMRAITPDFSGITAFCTEYGIETLACFTAQTEQERADFHLRDFCPAVGVPESAAAGTTNAALAAYLFRHGLIGGQGTGDVSLTVEQGLELGRPSTILGRVQFADGKILRLQVGGTAVKVFEGRLQVPEFIDP